MKSNLIVIVHSLCRTCVYLCVSVCVAVGDEVGGVAMVGVRAPLSLLLVDAIPLAFGQVEEVLHGLQVDQERLRGRARILLLTKDL